MRHSLMLAPLLLSLCTGGASAGDAGPAFSPKHFFSGRTEGVGTLKVLLGKPHTVRVHGHGRVTPNGTLVLDQRVEEEGKAPTTREWRIRSIGGGRYAGTLTDASGPVTGEASGNRLVLRYPMKGGLATEQTLVLQKNGSVAANHLVVRGLGVLPMATLDETIRRVR